MKRNFTYNENPFATLGTLQNKCKAFTDSEVRYQELIREHDEEIYQQGRKDMRNELGKRDYNKAIDDCKEVIRELGKWASGILTFNQESKICDKLENLKETRDIDYEDYFGGLTKEEYEKETEEHFKFIDHVNKIEI